MLGPKHIGVDERRAHLNRVAEMYAEGLTQVVIAQKTGVSQPMISKDIRTLHEEWAELRASNIDKARISELANLDRLQATAEEGYKRSQEKQERTHRRGRPVTSKDATGKDVESLAIIEINVVSETLPGDPRFLKIVESCIQQRREILGLDAPKRTELTGPNGGPIELDLALMTPDQRASRHAELRAKIERDAEERVMKRLQITQESVEVSAVPRLGSGQIEQNG